MARVDLPDGDDDELLRLYGLSPAMGAAAGNFTAAVYGDTSLPTRVREAARIRIAELNACPVCLDTRSTSDPDGLTEEEYVQIADWRDIATFSPRERIAVEFAERFTTDHLNLDDDFWLRARAEFTDPELFELGVCCASWLGLGRMTQIFGAGVSCRIEL
ncbi:MAG: carboxymuconolactone decarboxylase family protein [Actinobacteria bacterium]|nr:carboxymuconolactone decarboxylase family protein [Actinomycetota bacterium]